MSSTRLSVTTLITASLGYQLDELVRTGFLKDYVAEPATTATWPPPAEEQAHETPILGEVHTIAGGFSDGGPTASQRKKYARGDQRASGVSKQSFAEGVKEKDREGQRGVDGGSSKDRMGIPHHAPIFYHGDAFQFGVWVRRDDPGRDT